MQISNRSNSMFASFEDEGSAEQGLTQTDKISTWKGAKGRAKIKHGIEKNPTGSGCQCKNQTEDISAPVQCPIIAARAWRLQASRVSRGAKNRNSDREQVHQVQSRWNSAPAGPACGSAQRLPICAAILWVPRMSGLGVPSSGLDLRLETVLWIYENLCKQWWRKCAHAQAEQIHKKDPAGTLWIV